MACLFSLLFCFVCVNKSEKNSKTCSAVYLCDVNEYIHVDADMAK